MNEYLFWVDIKNSHEPAFFQPFMNHFGKEKFIVTARNYAEIEKLLNQRKISHITVGGHYGKNFISKVFGRFVVRNISLFLRVPKFKYGLSHMSMESAWVSKFRFKNVISFSDNELEQYYTKAQLPLIDYLIIPKAIDPNKFRKMGMRGSIIQYGGYKEDIYIADYEPDKNFLKKVPFKEFVAVRPEALQAEYVPKNAKSIVSDLLKQLDKEGYNILYLPRYPEDIEYAKGCYNIYIPPEPLNGLDICHYSQAVLTGSGTFAREAACMGTRAVSFYPGIELLAVDQDMVNKGWMLHSRDVGVIMEYLSNTKPNNKPDFSQSRKVKSEVIKIIEGILAGM